MAIQNGGFIMDARLPPFTIPEPRGAEGAPRDIATVELLVVVSLRNEAALVCEPMGIVCTPEVMLRPVVDGRVESWLWLWLRSNRSR